MLRWTLVVSATLSLGCEQKSPREDEGQPDAGSRSINGVALSSLELLLGRVTSIEPAEDALILGHENGVISVWGVGEQSMPREVNKRRATRPRPSPRQSWVAHEGAVRTLTYDESQDELFSLGAGGSWASWGQEMRVIKRERAPQVYANQVTRDGRGGWLIAGARGVVASWRAQSRRWVSAGEHGRAAFGVKRLDAERALSVGSDGWVRCWLIKSGETCGGAPLHDGWAVAIEPISLSSPASSAWWVTAGSDGLVKIWSAQQLERALASSLTAPSAAPLQGRRVDDSLKAHQKLRAHNKDITRLVYRDGLILTGSEEGSVSLIEVSSQGALSLRWRHDSDALKPVMSLALDIKRQRALIGGGRGALVWGAPLRPDASQPLAPLW